MENILLIKDILFIVFLSKEVRCIGGAFMYDTYLVNETDFVVQTNAEALIKENHTMNQGLCALNTMYSDLRAFKMQNGTCLMGNITATGKPDLNGTQVFVEIDHARATLDYSKFGFMFEQPRHCNTCYTSNFNRLQP